jgi:hypothetical protein
MDIEAYRQQYLQSLETAVASPAPSSLAAVTASLSRAGSDPKETSDIIASLPLDAGYGPTVTALLELLDDASVAPEVRLAALRKVGAAEFQADRFTPFRADFIARLRKLALDDDKALREAALERLSFSNDEEAQKLLREGLERKRKLLVSDAKAVQLLASDDHSGSVDLFRNLAVNGKGQVREQALRALAADSQSVPLFQQIATDKTEHPALREVALANLKSMAPMVLSDVGLSVVLDAGNSDRLRAAAVSALTHANDQVKRALEPFHADFEAVRATTRSRHLKSSIKHFNRSLRSK